MTCEKLPFSLRSSINSQPFICYLSTVPEAPADIKAVVVSRNSIIVTWKPPSCPNGIVTKYTVYVRSSQGDNEVI